MHYFGVETLSETLFPPPLMKPGYGARYNVGQGLVLDDYQICYCIGTIKDCSLDASFLMSAGRLTIRGPRGGDDTMCTAGSECDMGPGRDARPHP